MTPFSGIGEHIKNNLPLRSHYYHAYMDHTYEFGEQKYNVPLDESQTDPIRGRLEDPKNTPEEYPGWRWLQVPEYFPFVLLFISDQPALNKCTEYPGQCRILIPPHAASIYARLLEAEKWVSY